MGWLPSFGRNYRQMIDEDDIDIQIVDESFLEEVEPLNEEAERKNIVFSIERLILTQNFQILNKLILNLIDGIENVSSGTLIAILTVLTKLSPKERPAYFILVDLVKDKMQEEGFVEEQVQAALYGLK